MKKSAFISSVGFIFSMLMMASSHSAVITTFYGDDDGFGVGATTGTITPTVSHQSASEAAFTDQRLIGNGYEAPSFLPTGGFTPFVVNGTITGATLTMRTGSFDRNQPVDGNNTNQIVLDGKTVLASFINQFSNKDTNNVETFSIDLDSSFFASLSDGIVSLAGSRLSEGSGAGSFQVDFLKLTITTAAVPEPATTALLGLGLLGFAASRRKSTKSKNA